VPEREIDRLDVSPAQRRVLVALCRPVHGADRFGVPATNQQIADELCLTVAAVKTHLRSLSQRFGLGDVPQNAKRARLVQVAFELDLVKPDDFREG
jgi:predicted ArsR family transcriptional regulator